MTENVSHLFKINFNVINTETSEIIDLSDSLISLREKDNYVSNVFRHYVVILRIDNNQRKYLTENKVVFSFKILRTNNILAIDEEETDSTERAYDKEVEEDTIKPFNKPIIESIKNEDYDNEEDKTLDTQKVSYKAECVSIYSIEQNSNVINAVYMNTNITNVLVNIISENFKGKLFLQKPDNISLYRSVLIPPLNLIPAIRFINENYGLYNAGLSIFVEKNNFYLYSLTDFNRDFENKLNINVVNATQNTDSSIYSNIALNERNEVTVTYKNTPILGDVTDVVIDKVGTERIVNSLDDNLNIVTRNYEHSGDYNKVRYLWNESGVKLFENKRNLTKTAIINLNNLDPSLVNPNTEITINGASIADSNGRYVLLQKIVAYETSNFKIYKSSMSLTLAK